MLLAVAGLAGLGGCTADSWFDPSVTGYWEQTPTSMPILDRIAAIEDKTPEAAVEPTPPVREDLIAEAQAYRLGPSDEIQVAIPNFEQGGFLSQYPRTVDQRGYITLPRVGQVFISGKTDVEASAAIARAIAEADILRSPEVSVIIVAPRQQTFSILGGVRTPGTFVVTKPDYRLLDAMSAAGGFDETVENIYVIRQIPLSEKATGATTPPPQGPSTRPETAPPPDTEDLINEINRLTKPKTEPPPPPGGTPGAPAGPEKPGTPSGSPAVYSAHAGVAELGTKEPSTYTGLQPDQPGAPTKPKPTPPIDLIDSTATPTPPGAPPARPEGPGEQPMPTAPAGQHVRSRWVFLNGQWTRETAAPAPSSEQGTENPLAGTPPAEELMTQRVIEVPAKPLLAGKSDVNIVIRPGDVVRVPVAQAGIVYVGGQVARPGVFNLPPTGKLTLRRVIDAAGGLSQLGIPERVDITRIVGPNREATIMLNYRAISENTQPDVILKPDDRINVGTNFFAFPLAILRNGLRMSYGYGFILDRNFGNDIFGAPPGSFGG